MGVQALDYYQGGLRPYRLVGSLHYKVGVSRLDGLAAGGFFGRP